MAKSTQRQIQMREAQKRYRIKNRAKRALQAKQWREKNKDRVRVYSISYERDRSKKRAEDRRKQYAADPAFHRARAKRWRRLNPAKKLATKQVYRARKRGVEGRHTAEEMQELLLAQNFCCANPFCGVDLRIVKGVPDHIVALSKQGTNWIENMQWLCLPCNSRKSDLNLFVWLSREQHLRSAQY